MGRAVLVTGAARRMGAVIARHLAAQGWAVALHYLHSGQDAERLAADLTAQYGRRCVAVGADLADAAATRELVGNAGSALGEVLTAVVNNASSFDYDDATTMTVDSLDRAMRINCTAPLLLAQALAASQPTRPAGTLLGACTPQGACVINLLDQKLFNLNPDFLSYTLSKQALAGATALLARALAPVRVNGVAPGISLPSADQTAEEFARAHQCTPLGRSSTPEEVAATVAFLLDCAAITGQIVTVDGGQHMVPLARDVMFLTRDPVAGD